LLFGKTLLHGAPCDSGVTTAYNDVVCLVAGSPVAPDLSSFFLRGELAHSFQLVWDKGKMPVGEGVGVSYFAFRICGIIG
jgi:hypothetical protein